MDRGQGKGRVRVRRTGSSTDMHELLCVKEKASGKLSSVLCDDLEGWDGDGGGRSKREGICIHIAESLSCTGETNLILQSNDTALKEKK